MGLDVPGRASPEESEEAQGVKRGSESVAPMFPMILEVSKRMSDILTENVDSALAGASGPPGARGDRSEK